MNPGVVIAGGGQAGLEAAAALRTLAYQGTVTIVCGEPHAPYQRPPLSKEFLAGKQEADSLPLRAPVYYEKHQVDLILGDGVASIDRVAKQVVLNSGRDLPYTHLVLAVGARNRPLIAPGADRALYLRTVDEAALLRERLAQAQSVAVIGGGFIGLEVAAAARCLGKRVSVIEAAPRLMARAVSPLLSEFFLDVHREQGADIVPNAGVIAIERECVTLSDGRRIDADTVVAGIGVVPNSELARDAGLAVGNGILVDEMLRTSDPHIFAIGDCADHPNLFANAFDGGQTRLESVQNAVDQAKCVARVILGQTAPYRDVPWFWTDQYGIRFQMVGLAAGHNDLAMRGTIESRKFSVFYFKDERLLAVDSVNRFGDHVAARKLLTARTPLTPAQARDETLDLKKL